MNSVWEKIKCQIESELPKNSFSLWINPVYFLEKTDQTIILGCPNKFSRDWIRENYIDIVKDKFRESGYRDIDLILKVEPSKKKTLQDYPVPVHKQLALPSLEKNKLFKNLWLNSQYTFDRFIVGQSNEFAYSASKSIAMGNVKDYNSLLMLSNTGLGKTHLSQAIGHTILSNGPETRILYMTAEDFTNEMISSLRQKKIEAFKNRYRRSCDVLLLEDIHFLGGKEKIQAELGFTLDALAENKKKLVFTSALPPKDIPRMSKELSSRLTSGLVTTIAGPDYETRIKILSEKASALNISLSKDVMDLLASRLKLDVRQMESALKCLRAKSELVGKIPDINSARDVVNTLVAPSSSMASERIKQMVCTYYKIDAEMLSSRSRKKIYGDPRNIYSYLCRKHSDETLEEIGKGINRSHSTVVYAAEVVDRKIKTDRTMRYQVNFLSKQLEEGSS